MGGCLGQELELSGAIAGAVCGSLCLMVFGGESFEAVERVTGTLVLTLGVFAFGL